MEARTASDISYPSCNERSNVSRQPVPLRDTLLSALREDARACVLAAQRRQVNKENVPPFPLLSPSNLLVGERYTRLDLATVLQSALDIVEEDNYEDSAFGDNFRCCPPGQ
jgi:hypothetical protein